MCMIGLHSLVVQAIIGFSALCTCCLLVGSWRNSVHLECSKFLHVPRDLWSLSLAVNVDIVLSQLIHTVTNIAQIKCNCWKSMTYC